MKRKENLLSSYYKLFSWQRDGLIAGFAVVIFAFIGPFGTFDDMGFVTRLLFWAIAILGCGTIFWLVIFLVSQLSFLSNIAIYPRHLFIVFLMSFPGALLIYAINLFFRDIAFPPERWAWIWLTVFVISMSITSLNYFSHFGKSLSKKEIHKEEIAKIHIETDENISLFFAKLPKDIGTELISLSAHDHYIEVVTKSDKEMLYMKFSKAMELLKNYPGKRIHRSHWVADNAVESIKKNGRNKSVKLVDGRILPISAKYKDALSDM